jgi:hypothetical protein
MPARHAGRDVLTETIRWIDVERGATGELNGIFGLKLVELLKERLPDIGNGHLTSNPDFHGNNLIQIAERRLYLQYTIYDMKTQLSYCRYFADAAMLRVCKTDNKPS